jgi:hypothetical protein
VNTTRYAGMARRPAILILVFALCFTALCLALAPRATLVPKQSENSGASDMDIYRNVVHRVHTGEGYYEALGAELRVNKRPTTAIVNWRTPLHLVTLALAPSSAWWRIPQVTITVVVLVIALVIMQRAGMPFLSMFQVLLMIGSLLLCFVEPGLYFVEAWAGLMIVLSIEAYAFGWKKTGIATGLLALFLRELAMPYVLVCALLAFRKKDRPEMLAWSLGLVAYVAYFGVHAALVTSRILPGDISNPVSWVQFGGVKLMVSASSMGALVALPPWVTALYLPAALLGLGGWKDPVALRVLATVVAYLGAFAIVGHPVNIYWGAMYAPLLTFGVAWSIPAIHDLMKAVAVTKQVEISPTLASVSD